jgi:hypothetical protein
VLDLLSNGPRQEQDRPIASRERRACPADGGQCPCGSRCRSFRP